MNMLILMSAFTVCDYFLTKTLNLFFTILIMIFCVDFMYTSFCKLIIFYVKLKVVLCFKDDDTLDVSHSQTLFFL